MANAPVLVVDYGVGNIGSIVNMLRRIGVQAIASATASAVDNASRIILPGVGSFDTAMARLAETGIVPALEKRVLHDRVPILGICLGMQILTRGSEEGQLPGLGWLDADVVRIRPESAGRRLRIPHMGWNQVRPRGSHALFEGLERGARFYFVHSYHAVSAQQHVLCTTDYGYEFASGLVKENVLGVQFHPEKSHKYGLQLLKNFVNF